MTWRATSARPYRTEIPVAFNRPKRELAKEKLVVLGHTTDRASSPLFLAGPARCCSPRHPKHFEASFL
jgi:hypothetical protein